MAPEIIIGKQYTEKADVYAFGIILWEILTRLEPYEDKEPMQIVVEVVNDGLRPTIPAEYKDNALVGLMRACWHELPDERPTFAIVVERLQKLFDDEIKIHPLEKDELEAAAADGESSDPQHPGDNPNNKRPSRQQAADKSKDHKTPPKAAGAAGAAASAATAAGGGGGSGSAKAEAAPAAAAPGGPALQKAPSANTKPPGGK